MRGKFNIFRSLYVKILILAVIIIMAVMGGLIGLNDRQQELTIEEMAELTGPDFETIYPLGRHDEIYVADAEEGLFVYQSMTHTVLEDKDGNIITSFPGYVEEHVGNSFVIYNDGEWYFLNMTQLAEKARRGDEVIVPEETYDRVSLDKTGKFVLFKKDNEYFVTDCEGDVIYTPRVISNDDSNAGAYLIGPEGYIIEEDTAGIQHIINMLTGEEEFTVPEGVVAVDFIGDMWIMDCHGEAEKPIYCYYYFMNRDYEVDPDGGIYTGYNMEGASSDDFVSVQQTIDITYETRSKMHGNATFGIVDHENKILNVKGKSSQMVELAGMSSEDSSSYIRYIKGNMAAISGYNETLIDYFDLETGEAIFRNSKYFTFMDFEDGAAAASVSKKFAERDSRTGTLLEGDHRMEEYKWGLVDENLQPLTEFVFDGVWPGDNGYAVIMKDGQKGLIRYKGAN